MTGHVGHYNFRSFRSGGRLAGEASRQSGALVSVALREVFGGALREVFVVDGGFERPVAAIEFGSDGVGDGSAEGVGDVVDVFVVGAVGAVAGRCREVIVMRFVEGCEFVGDSFGRIVVENHVEHVGRVVEAVRRCKHVGVVDGKGKGEFGFGFGGECDCIHEMYYNFRSFSSGRGSRTGRWPAGRAGWLAGRSDFGDDFEDVEVVGDVERDVGIVGDESGDDADGGFVDVVGRNRVVGVRIEVDGDGEWDLDGVLAHVGYYTNPRTRTTAHRRDLEVLRPAGRRRDFSPATPLARSQIAGRPMSARHTFSADTVSTTTATISPISSAAYSPLRTRSAII